MGELQRHLMTRRVKVSAAAFHEQLMTLRSVVASMAETQTMLLMLSVGSTLGSVSVVKVATVEEAEASPLARMPITVTSYDVAGSRLVMRPERLLV